MPRTSIGIIRHRATMFVGWSYLTAVRIDGYSALMLGVFSFTEAYVLDAQRYVIDAHVRRLVAQAKVAIAAYNMIDQNTRRVLSDALVERGDRLSDAAARALCKQVCGAELHDYTMQLLVHTGGGPKLGPHQSRTWVGSSR